MNEQDEKIKKNNECTHRSILTVEVERLLITIYWDIWLRKEKVHHFITDNNYILVDQDRDL